MGDEADDILASFGLTEDEKKVYDTVKGKFESYFIRRRNVIFERAKFNRRDQKEGESVDSFITALHGLAEHCKFGVLWEEMIRDRIVVGLKDLALSEKLQMDPDLTLLKATETAREREAIKQQQEILRKEETQIDIVSQDKKSNGIQCKKCGRKYYQERHRCPALYATCYKCHRKGHFQAVCLSQIKEIRSDPTAEVNAAFLGAVHDSMEEQPWETLVYLNNKSLVFKLDTGADVTVISSADFVEYRKTVKLKPPDRQLYGPGSAILPVIGYFLGTLRHKDKITEEIIYVVKHLNTPLLGRRAITKLRLAQRLDVVENGTIDPVKEFPTLFGGLGKLEGEHVIRLREEARPYSLAVPRRVAIPLFPKVKEELLRMEELGVISPVTEPTDWCAGMVVVPKSNGKVRICVDMTKLNENVKRERHILPSVEQTLAQLGGAQVFTKLDANSGFWQIPLDTGSSFLTTFITPFGRFRFNRLPFGITSAPEHFQRRMSTILSGLEGVVCQADDILVYGKSQEQHDKNVRNVLQKLREVGLTLNRDKCIFSQKQIKFLGQVIDNSGVSPDQGRSKRSGWSGFGLTTF